MKNHKGFTIVEMLIGITILSIVAVALTGFIVSSSKSYAASNTEIIVQQESQLAMNQISDVIIDTTRSVNYVGYSLDGSVSEQVVKDADFTIDVEDKSLVLYNGEGKVVVDASGNPVLDADGNPEIVKDAEGNPEITGGNGNKNYQIYWDKSEEKLYFSEIEIADTVFPEGERVLLAEYVKDFSVDLSQVEEKRVVKLTISYGYNNKVYETSNNITIRNKVLVNSINLAVNRTVELSIRTKETMVVLEPGEDYYKFSTPIIEGRNILDKSVTWSIPDEEQSKLTAGWDTKFTDAANGIIHISEHESADNFKVRVTTNMADSAGNQAWAEVTVYVKRAKWISMNKSADSDPSNGAHEISPGCTFTISANVEGTKLGVTCSKCGDEVEIDRQVVYEGNPYGNPYVWILADIDSNDDWNPYDHLELLESKPNSSTWRVKSSVPDDGSFKFVVQCCSLLSVVGNDCGRHYDYWVTGGYELTVKKKGDLTLSADGLKYGSRDLYLKWDYVPHTAYICVRIKEDDNAPVSTDKVMIYKTDGKAILIAPDVFGLDLNKNYILYIQVLAADTDGHGNDIQTPEQVVADYNSHIDSTGTYVGSLKASSRLREDLNKPQLTIRYNNKDYSGEEVNVGPIHFLSSEERTISCGDIVKVSSAKGNGGEIINGVKTNLYLGAGEDNPLYEWGESKNGKDNKGLLKFNKENGKINIAMGKVDGNDITNNNISKIDEARESIGDYHYIPYFYYKNETVASAFTVCYKNYTPIYNEQLCERPESKISFSITDKSNTDEFWAYTNSGEFKKGKVLLPLPSESSFYFTKDTNWQSVVPQNSFILTDKDGNMRVVELSRITGRYISTEDAYEIEIFYKCYDSFWNQKVEMSAGTFKCSAKGTEWKKVGSGTLDAQLSKGNYTVTTSGNAKIKIGNEEKEAYVSVPLPSESAFTYQYYGGLRFDAEKLENDGEYTVENLDVNNNINIAYKKDSSSVDYVKCTKATCEYNKNDGTYKLTLYYGDDESSSVKLTWKKGDSAWTAVR